MGKVCLQNLGMIITERCNLNCGHCMRGGCSNKVMSDEVIEATLDQVCAIGCLSICGGEPLLALDRIEKIFTSIIEKEIVIDKVAVTINGTIYEKDFLDMLDFINEYIVNFDGRHIYLDISNDIYHKREIERLGLKEQYFENVRKYSKSPHFYEMRQLSRKLFREGNAQNLDLDLTVPLRPMNTVLTYTSENKLNKIRYFNKKRLGLCNIGPLVTVNVNGTITECDASIENQETVYNYGNVLIDSIEDVCLNRGEVIMPVEWYRTTGQIMKRYGTYNK